MTYLDTTRLDRIEALIQSNSQQIESNSRQLAQLSQTTQFLTTVQLELALSVDVNEQSYIVMIKSFPISEGA